MFIRRKDVIIKIARVDARSVILKAVSLVMKDMALIQMQKPAQNAAVVNIP